MRREKKGQWEEVMVEKRVRMREEEVMVKMAEIKIER